MFCYCDFLLIHYVFLITYDVLCFIVILFCVHIRCLMIPLLSCDFTFSKNKYFLLCLLWFFMSSYVVLSFSYVFLWFAYELKWWSYDFVYDSLNVCSWVSLVSSDLLLNSRCSHAYIMLFLWLRYDSLMHMVLWLLRLIRFWWFLWLADNVFNVVLMVFFFCHDYHLNYWVLITIVILVCKMCCDYKNMRNMIVSNHRTTTDIKRTSTRALLNT